MPTVPRRWAALGPREPAHALYAAWWGKEVAESRLDDVYAPDTDKSSDMDTDTLSSQTFINIDQSIDTDILGKMLLRREFLTTQTFIESYASRKGKGLVITGQPGIGKTYLLWYLLRFRLSKERPTMFALGDSTFFFHETGPYEDRAGERTLHLQSEAIIASEPHVLWSLFDRMNLKTEPDLILWKGRVFPVQTASPDPSRFQQWLKEKRGDIFTMNPWDCGELAAGLLLQKDFEGQCDFSLLDKVYDKYGTAPRTVYEAYFRGGAIPDIDDTTTRAITKATQSFDQLESIVSSTFQYGPDPEISNKIICLKRRDTSRACATVLSRFVLDELLKAKAFAARDKKRQVCELFAGIPEMGASRGYSFES